MNRQGLPASNDSSRPRITCVSDFQSSAATSKTRISGNLQTPSKRREVGRSYQTIKYGSDSYEAWVVVWQRYCMPQLFVCNYQLLVARPTTKFDKSIIIAWQSTISFASSDRNRFMIRYAVTDPKASPTRAAKNVENNAKDYVRAMSSKESFDSSTAWTLWLALHVYCCNDYRLWLRSGCLPRFINWPGSSFGGLTVGGSEGFLITLSMPGSASASARMKASPCLTRQQPTRMSSCKLTLNQTTTKITDFLELKVTEGRAKEVQINERQTVQLLSQPSGYTSGMPCHIDAYQSSSGSHLQHPSLIDLLLSQGTL